MVIVLYSLRPVIARELYISIWFRVSNLSRKFRSANGNFLSKLLGNLCKIFFFAKRKQSSCCGMEKFWFLSNENWTKISRKWNFFAKMRSKSLAKIHRNSWKFWTKLNEFRSFNFANLIQRKFGWKPIHHIKSRSISKVFIHSYMRESRWRSLDKLKEFSSKNDEDDLKLR